MSIGVKLEPITKIFVNISFVGVRVDAKAAGNNFLGSLDILELLENGWILGHF